MREVLGEGRFLQLIVEDSWERVERIGSHGVVIVFATDTDGNLILLEQFRKPVNSWVIEWPAGLIDPGEKAEKAAHRELLEETGFEAAELTPVGEALTSPGLTIESVQQFVAARCEKVAAGGGVDSEQIRIHTVSPDRFESWLQHRREEGCRLDAKIHAGLYHLRQAGVIS